jgi:hypothetical protein
VIGARRKKGLLEALALMMTNDVAPMVVEEKLLLWSSLANFVFFSLPFVWLVAGVNIMGLRFFFFFFYGCGERMCE